MNFEKKTMKIKEFEDYGFKKSYLLSLHRIPGQNFAWKQSDSRNSPVLFDTDALKAYIDSERKKQLRAIRRY